MKIIHFSLQNEKVMPRNRRKNVRNNRNSRNDWRNITSEDSEVDLDDSDDSDDFNNCSDTFSLLEKKRNLRKRPTSKVNIHIIINKRLVC